MKYYRQCEFRNGASRTTAWIEERGAKVGYRVSFEEEPGVFWEVVSVGSRMTEAGAKSLERLHLKHRQFSDI